MKFIFFLSTLFVGLSPAVAKVEARFGSMLDIGVTELLDKPTKRVSVPANMLVKPPSGTECSYYGKYMIKQNFVGNPYSQSTLLVPIESTAKTKCAESWFAGQVSLSKELGLFLGIKGDYAFFQGDEARNPSFIVLRLHDQAIIFVGRAQVDPAARGMQIRTVEIKDKDLILSYVQNTPMTCSAGGKDKNCVAKIAKQTKLKKEIVQRKCAAGYQTHLQTIAKYWCRENNPKDPACMTEQAKKMQGDNSKSLSEIHEFVDAHIPAAAKSLKPAKSWDSLLKASTKYIAHVDLDFDCGPQP